MRKKSVYECHFSSMNDLTMILGYFCISVRCYTIKECMSKLRGLGFHLGKDFYYYKKPDFYPYDYSF